MVLQKGPKSNPAKLPSDGKYSIYALFAQIFRAAIDTASSQEPVRFLSRYDKSAANIAESRIWATIGQTPWAHPYSPWYHRFVGFPFQALRAASKLGEYAIMDRGTWYAVEPEVRDAMAVFVSSITSPTIVLFHTRPCRHANESHCDHNRQPAQTPEKTIRY
jgi:ABC-type tungstate transport system permease subunit